MLSAPTSTAPAVSRRSTRVASRMAGDRLRLIFDPASVGRPATSKKFFTAKGTAASGPSGAPLPRGSPSARALARARPARIAVKALRAGLRAAMRASASSITAAAVTRPAATAAAISAAEAQPRSTRVSDATSAIALRLEYRRRVRFVRQRELGDDGGKPQRQCQIGAHRGLPGGIDRQVEHARRGGDVVVERSIGHGIQSFVTAGAVAVFAPSPLAGE